MNTTTAALQANVTVATIRTWCRNGVIAATKTAGRWVVNAASLAHRIAIAAMRTRKATRMIDLTATYTYTPAGFPEPLTVTPTVKRRTSADGERLTIIRGLAPLLADRIDAIADPGDRGHALTVLANASIVICDQARPGLADAHVREDGRLATTYAGTRSLPVEAVLDLAEQLRAAL
jgi:hypothetical protein